MSENRKTYILDTKVLLASPYCIHSFDEYNVVIADATIEELEQLQAQGGAKARNATEALRNIEALCKRGPVLNQTLPNKHKGTFCVHTVPPKNVEVIGLEPTYQNRILKTCNDFSMVSGREGKKNDVILVSNSLNMRLKAEARGVKAEEYRSDQSAAADKQYTGRREVLWDDVDLLYQHKSVPAPDDSDFEENEFLLLKSRNNPSHSALAVHQAGVIFLLHRYMSPISDVKLKNVGQKFAAEALLRPVEKAPLVILKGPAGTAKTYLTLATGLQKVLVDKSFQRILVSRPNVKFDEDIGYLKGSELDKIGPLIRPIYDNLEQLTKIHDGNKDNIKLPSSYADDLISSGTVKAEALAYMRGRSIADSWIIIDEAQNMTPAQAYGIITRVGVNSKVILCGDPEQVDSPFLDSRTNGLSFASERMKGSPLCWQLTFSDKECVRSPLALQALARMAPKGAA